MMCAYSMGSRAKKLNKPCHKCGGKKEYLFNGKPCKTTAKVQRAKKYQLLCKEKGCPWKAAKQRRPRQGWQEWCEKRRCPKCKGKIDFRKVCANRFETSYDNDTISVVGVDRKIISSEKLVQVYSRANRRRESKLPPLVVDFQNVQIDAELRAA